MTHRYFLLLGLGLATHSVMAQEPARRQFSLEARGGHDRLSGGRAPWNNQSVTARFRYTLKTGLGAGAERVERFRLIDQKFFGDASTAVGRRLTLGVNGVFSPTHHVIARHVVGGYGYLSLPGGWGIEAGGQKKAYEGVTVSAYNASVDRYFGPFMATYRVGPVRLPGSGTAVAHMVRLTRFIGEAGSMSIVATGGKEVDAFTASGPLVAQVKGGAIFGALPLTSQVAFVFAAEYSDHRNLFTRQHASLGLRLTSKAVGAR